MNSISLKKELVISLDDKKLLKYLRKTQDSYHFFSFSKGKNDVISRIGAKHFKIEYAFGQIENDRFLKLYIDLIGGLSARHNSKYWWATSLASKDRLGSGLFEKLYELHLSVNMLKYSDCNRIIIINPSREIVGSLIDYCLSQSYKLTILAKKNYGFVLKKGFFSVSNKLFFIGNTWRKIFLARRHFLDRFNKKINFNKSHYVLRTWIFESSLNRGNDYRDTYFGELPDFLLKKGIKPVIIAGILNDYRNVIRKIEQHTKHAIFPQELFSSYFDPVKTVLSVVSNKINFSQPIFFDGYEISNLIQSEIDKEYNGRQIYYSYINYLHVKKLSEIINIMTFTITYENYPWEKMCLISLKRNSPQTRSIGYQHVQFYPAFTNYYISKFEKDIIPLPDVIFTSGSKAKDFMKTCGFDGEKLKTGCALKAITANISVGNRRKIENILVILSEYNRAKMLIKSVYLALKDRSNLIITIRPHPVTPIKRLMHELGKDILSNGNITFSSTSSLSQDFDNTDLVIYDASTICFDALRRGIPVISVRFQDVLSFDPLFMLHDFKWSANEPKELLEAINKISDLPDDEYLKLQSSAINFVDNYLIEATDHSMEKFLGF